MPAVAMPIRSSGRMACRRLARLLSTQAFLQRRPVIRTWLGGRAFRARASTQAPSSRRHSCENSAVGLSVFEELAADVVPIVVVDVARREQGGAAYRTAGDALRDVRPVDAEPGARTTEQGRCVHDYPIPGTAPNPA